MKLIKHSQLTDGKVFKRGEPLGIVNDDGRYLVFEARNKINLYDCMGQHLSYNHAPRTKKLSHFHRDFLMILMRNPPFVVVTYENLLFLTTAGHEDC